MWSTEESPQWGLESTVFHHILIPADLSGRTSEAVDMACKLGGAAAERLTLFHAIEPIHGASYEEFQSFYRELEGRAATHLSGLAVRCEGSALKVECVVVIGKPAEEIVRFAAEKRIDLIVLASHRIDDSSSDRDWGTLSHKVGVLAPCPVLLVK